MTSQWFYNAAASCVALVQNEALQELAGLLLFNDNITAFFLPFILFVCVRERSQESRTASLCHRQASVDAGTSSGHSEV